MGIDLGATNLKWAVVEHEPGSGAVEGAPDAHWAILDRGQAPTRATEGPEAVIGRLVDIGRAALANRPGIVSLGIGVPGLYDPVTGATRFLVNVPGEWAGRPVAVPVSAALGVPVVLVNDARA
ncbi:MAG: hypothetical protein C4343_03780, partial [Chloroflexota bacterium]